MEGPAHTLAEHRGAAQTFGCNSSNAEHCRSLTASREPHHRPTCVSAGQTPP